MVFIGGELLGSGRVREGWRWGLALGLGIRVGDLWSVLDWKFDDRVAGFISLKANPL
jgi:hypothetical protein